MADCCADHPPGSPHYVPIPKVELLSIWRRQPWLSVGPQGIAAPEATAPKEY